MTDKAPEQKTFGAFEIVEELSRTSRSVVLKAVQPPSKRPVVVKVLPEAVAVDAERVEQFQNDAKALAKINHSNVVLVLDGGVEAGSLYLVMEFVPLSALSKILRHRRLGLAESLAVFREICLGLRAVHAEKVVHRNLNPTSILVSDDLSMIKVGGFGSCADPSALSSELETLATGRLNVAFHYVAPEQLKGDAADERGDIYSLGIILYEMLTGRVPLGRVGLPSRINTELPAEVDRLVLDCLASKPEDRLASADQVLKAVQRLEDRLKLGVVSEFTGLVRGTTRMVRQRAGMLMTLAVVGVVTLGVGGYWLLVRGDATGTSEVGGREIRVAALEKIDLPAEPESAILAPPPPDANATDPVEVADSPVVSSPVAPSAESEVVAAAASEQPAATAPSARPGADDLAVARDKYAAGLRSEALTDLQEVTAGRPSGEVALGAYLLIAQIHVERQDPQAARAALVEARSRYPRSPGAAEVVFRLAKLTAAERGRENQVRARGLYAALATDYPRSDWAPTALAARAVLEESENLKVRDAELELSVPTALTTWRELARRYPNSPPAELAFWSLGSLYGDLKQFDLAAEAYVALGKRFPKSPRDAWWEAAQLYEKRLEDDTAAVKAYGKVPTTSSHYRAAQRRVKKLGG